jgi:hypothetical protein
MLLRSADRAMTQLGADIIREQHMRNARRSLRQTGARASAVALVLAVGVLFAQDSSGKPQSLVSAAEKLPAPATVTVNGVEEPVYGVYKPQNGITAPRCIKQKSPKFSGKARKDKVQGVVLLILVVTREGGVTDIRVKDGLGQRSR